MSVMISVSREAIAAVKESLAGMTGDQVIRIDIHSTGCCDASLGLCVDQVREGDLMEKTEGVTFVVSTEVHELVGDVTVSYADEKGKKGFVLTSTKPMSEWNGFGVCDIRQ